MLLEGAGSTNSTMSQHVWILFGQKLDRAGCTGVSCLILATIWPITSSRFCVVLKSSSVQFPTLIV